MITALRATAVQATKGAEATTATVVAHLTPAKAAWGRAPLSLG